DTMDGSSVLVARREDPTAMSGGVGYAGLLLLAGGDRPDGGWTVSAGQKVGFALEAKLLDDAHKARLQVHFYQADGTSISVLGAYDSGDPVAHGERQWQRLVSSAVAPTNAAYFTVEILLYGDASLDGPIGAAFRKPQVNFLGS